MAQIKLKQIIETVVQSDPSEAADTNTNPGFITNIITMTQAEYDTRFDSNNAPNATTLYVITG